MRSAVQLQPAAVPPVWPAFPGLAWAGSCRSALEVGGDFYDVLRLSENSLLLVIADVMGKGLPAALFADSLRNLIRSIARAESSPGELLYQVNELMFAELSSAELFITVQLVRADWHTRQLHIASAGHCPLLVSDRHGRFGAITPEGLPLGIQTGTVFENAFALLPPRGAVLLYTDGITEARDRRGWLFGQERLANWFGSSLRTRSTACQLRAGLLRELAGFQGRNQAADDQTFILLCDETPDDLDSSPNCTGLELPLRPG